MAPSTITPEKPASAIRAPGGKQPQHVTPHLTGTPPPVQRLHDVQSYSPSQMLWLQRTVGNRAVQSMLRPQPALSTSSGNVVQAKLNVGPVNDRYEQEADRVAKQVVSMTGGNKNAPVQRHHDERHHDGEEVQLKPLGKSITPMVRRHPAHADEEETVQGKWLVQRHPGHADEEGVVQGQRTAQHTLQRHPSHADEEETLQGKRTVQREQQGRGVGIEGGTLDAQTEHNIRSTQGGQPLDKKVRGSMEHAFGANFSGVRVHTSAKADSLNRSLQARAFTTGQNIFFRQGQYNPGSHGGKQLLAHELTHVVQQNSGVVQTKRTVGKQMPDKTHKDETHHDDAHQAVSQDGRGVIRRNFFKRLFGLGKKKREAKLSQKHGVKIGSQAPDSGDKAHFSHGMMDKIDKVLSGLPEEHIRGNDKLKTIGSLTPAEKAQNNGPASTYDPSTGKISMNKPFSWMPWWLYTMLSPKHKWQRKQMDKGAMSDYKGITKEKDEELGINHDDRSVFAGVSDAMVRKGGLATQTLRHEMGHAVDDKIKFTRTRAYIPLFGGWRSYGDDTRIEKIARKALKHAGVDDRIINFKTKTYSVIKDFAYELSEEQPKLNWDPAEKARGYVGTYAAFNKGMDGSEKNQMTAELTQQLAKYKEFATWAHVQPWTISDGGRDKLELGDGRLYQKDHYGNWSSYLADKRKHAVSNYQFSSPGEWFAEAYAAYYDPDPNFAGRELLEPGVRAWFEKNLGHHVKAQRIQASLVDDEGKLTELRPHEQKYGLAGQNEEEEDVLPQKDGDIMEAFLEMNEFREFDEDIEK